MVKKSKRIGSVDSHLHQLCVPPRCTGPGVTIYLDDISVTTVPESSTYALIGVGLAGFVRRRQRRSRVS